MNHITLVGRTGRAAQTRYTQAGQPDTSFPLADRLAFEFEIVGAE